MGACETGYQARSPIYISVALGRSSTGVFTRPQGVHAAYRAYYSRHTVAVLPRGSPSQSPLLLYMPSHRMGDDLKHSRSKSVPLRARGSDGIRTRPYTLTGCRASPIHYRAIAGRESRRKNLPASCYKLGMQDLNLHRRNQNPSSCQIRRIPNNWQA